MTPLPHAAWAGLYDAVYERGYGRFYDWMTRITIEQIELAIPPLARVVDFGAGTGRLAIPLAHAGYEVTAVEPVEGMLARLDEKARERGVKVQTFHGRMDQFRAGRPFDLAVCVFTVLLYILEEDVLQRSFQAVSDSLRPGGLFLVDVPRMEMFTAGIVRGQGVKREIEITARGGELFDYREHTTVDVEGRVEIFDEAFPIRYWPAEMVLKRLAGVGLALEKDLSPLLRRSGCDYYLMKKS